jgi:dethiobiotin synthetase
MPLDMNLTKTKGLFITGTDTGVGKTLIAGAIARILSNKGLKVGVFKPVASGCRRDREGLISSDTEFLAHCANSDFPLSTINPITFLTPAAPIACQEHENRKVDFDQIADAYNFLCQNCDLVIVEGIGGAMVPISQDVDVLDLAKAFDLNTVIVARPDLGTINHTLLTIGAIRNAGLRLAGVVINGYDIATADLAIETAPAIIAQTSRTEILSIVPFDDESNVEEGNLGELITETLDDCDWKNLANS